jgi:type I restriction enzyme S subunit
MTEWKECKLGDVGLLQRGRSRHRPRYAFHLYGGKYPFIQTGEIREARKYITQYTQTYNEVGLEQSKLWPTGTLCITIAANIAELAILSFDACFPDSVLGFIPDPEKANLDFVYYTLTHFQKELKYIGEGSVQDNINLGTFEDVLFPFPPLPEQYAIASVLSSLDDKIDLLHRQNKTLEAMAEMLFRQWFVEEADEGWESVRVSDFVKTNISSIDKDFNLKTIRYLDTGSLTEGKIDYFQIFDSADAPSRARRIVKHNDILISTVRPNQKHYGIIKHPDEDIIVSTGFCVITCDKINPHFIYMLLTTEEMTEYLHSIAEGSTSTYPSLKPSDIEDIEFQLPSGEKYFFGIC